ncbi:MAG: penicillin-binding protein 2 [Treponema sp.]|jgi:cell division protein FtsI (penicillin-binding protein 3)|nr:penicillin-binding protein 2 [Treponema sp.]
MSFSPDPKQIKRRFFLFALILMICAGVVFIRYFVVMMNPPGAERYASVRPLYERGSIVDRNGRILALQTRLGNISVWKPDISDPEAIALALAPILETTPEAISAQIASSASDFLYLKKQADQSVIRRVQSLRARGELGGVSIEPVMGRLYPEKGLAAQVVGFTGTNNAGLGGIEYAFDAELRPGENRNGNQVVLTIDTNIQYILEDVARRALEENKAEAVMLMALDPRSGDILGSASLPGFDPNELDDSSEITRMDRPAIWAYEPGSVFKVFSLAALLESQSIFPETTFFCDGHYERVSAGGERIVINCLSAHGNVNARDIIVYSCNSGAAYASDRMGISAFDRALEAFGFGQRTGAGNPGETPGFLRPASEWSQRSKPTIAMGQEIAVSALQMLQAATAVANDGIMAPPRIVARIVSDDGRTIKEFEAGKRRRVISAQTAADMRAYMAEGTMGLGIGRFARIRDISLGVKTGTAQIVDPATGRYSEDDYIASCLALLPAENPSLILYMVIIKPRGDYYFGSRTAAPGIRDTAEALIDYLGIPRGRNPQVSHSGEVTIPAGESFTLDSVIPDFTGVPKRSLTPLLLRDDLLLVIRGEGWVRRQSPPPGTPFTPGMTIVLELE